jgi:hypothetical protein
VWAKGLLCTEAAVALLIGHRSWLYRNRRGIRLGGIQRPGDGGGQLRGCGVRAGGWHAAVLGGEGQVLRIAASIGQGVPVDLREAVTGLDENNAVLASAQERQ